MGTVMQAPPRKQLTEADVQYVLDSLDPSMIYLYTNVPFWGLLLERCDIIVTYQVPTAAISEDAKLYINPEYWRTLTNSRRTFILAHEVAHVAFQHHQRKQWRDQFKFNIATDHSINILLVEDMGQHALPDGALYDLQYKDLIAEEIYNRLPEIPKMTFFQSGSGEDDDDGGGDLLPPDADIQGEMVREARISKPTTKEEWDMAVSEAAAHCTMQGAMSAGLARAVNKHLKPQIDWATQLRTEIRHNLATVGRNHYRMIPPNRRYIWQDIYLPSMYDNTLKMAVAVDTSGSMSDMDLSIAYTEINAIRKTMNAQCYVMASDADIADGAARWVNTYEDLPPFVGGGGTDFIPVFNHVEEQRIQPDLLVYFTDTYGAFPDNPPDFPVIWVVHGDGTVPWGKMIRVGSYN